MGFIAFDRREHKPNFESASLAFSISVPVHDDTGKFRHFCKDTKKALRVQFCRGISRKWSTIYRGKSRTSCCWRVFLPLTFFALKSFAKKVKKTKQNNINIIQASLLYDSNVSSLSQINQTSTEII